MKTSRFDSRLIRGVLALAVCAAFGLAYADDAEDIAKQSKPESSVTGGVAVVNGDKRDRARFGQYNGMRDHNGYLIFDFDVKKRDEASGTWTIIEGRDLGLNIPELRFTVQKQGDWKLTTEYNAIVRNYPNTINTNLSGIGTTLLGVNRVAPGTGTNVDLKTERKGITVSGEKWLTSGVQFEASVKTEEKSGARIFGRALTCNATSGLVANGYGCSNTQGAILLLPEPINYTMTNVDARLNWHTDKLMLSGAYYGSFFKNPNGSMSQVFGGNLFNPNGTQFSPLTTGAGNFLANPYAMGNPVALQPDNQSHQFSLAGNYTFTPTTRSTFKYSFTRNTQNEDFAGMGLGTTPGTNFPNIRSNYGGLIDTSVGQVGITSRLWQKVGLLGNLRVEQKSDKSPIDNYNLSGKTNGHSSHVKVAGKLEASYQLPANYRVTVGTDVDMKDVGTPFASQDVSGQATAIRQKTQEIGYRAELRKAMSETITGSLRITHSKRNGSTWMTTANGNHPTFGNGNEAWPSFALLPLMMADLKRDKVKTAIDWAPLDRLSLQFYGEVGAETYLSPSQRGARDAATRQAGLDANFAISDKWKMTAFFSHNDQILKVDGTAGAYSEVMRILAHNLGLGVRGKPTAKWNVGSDLRLSYEANRYAQGYTTTTLVGQPADLPAVAYRQLFFSMFGTYAVDKKADVRLDLLHQRYKTNEWYWSNAGVPFFYSDGTTVSQQASQSVTMLKASYIYKF